MTKNWPSANYRPPTATKQTNRRKRPTNTYPLDRTWSYMIVHRMYIGRLNIDWSTGRSSIISIYHDSIGRLNIDRSTPSGPPIHIHQETKIHSLYARVVNRLHFDTRRDERNNSISCVELHLLRQTTIVTNRTGQTSRTLGQRGQSIQRSNRA